MLEAGISCGESSGAFWIRENEAARVVEGITSDHAESTIPHELGIERRVDDRWGPALVAWSSAGLAHHIIAIHADGDGLRVSKGMVGRVTSSAGIVPMQPQELVKEPQATRFYLAWV